MLEVCAKNAATWTYCTPQLKRSVDFWRSVCERNVDVLKYVSGTDLAHPEPVWGDCERDAWMRNAASLMLGVTDLLGDPGRAEVLERQ